MQREQRFLDGGGPEEEIQKTVGAGKLSQALADKTIAWLRNQSDYNPGSRVYKNAVFGYDPFNARIQKLTKRFWAEYSKEELSYRDQPFWSYFLSSEGMSPIPFPLISIRMVIGAEGEKGFNGHIYWPSEATVRKEIKPSS